MHNSEPENFTNLTCVACQTFWVISRGCNKDLARGAAKSLNTSLIVRLCRCFASINRCCHPSSGHCICVVVVRAENRFLGFYEVSTIKGKSDAVVNVG